MSDQYRSPDNGRFEPGDVVLTEGPVLLRLVDSGDVDAITAACQDPDLQRYIPVPRPYQRTDAEEYVDRALELWRSGRKHVFTVLDAHDTSEFLGVISITVAGRTGNAAYWLAPSARGRGAAGAALRALARWAFEERDLAVILLEIHDSNESSKRVALSAGFHQAGSVEVNTEDGPRGALLFVRLASDRPLLPRPR